MNSINNTHSWGCLKLCINITPKAICFLSICYVPIYLQKAPRISFQILQFNN